MSAREDRRLYWSEEPKTRENLSLHHPCELAGLRHMLVIFSLIVMRIVCSQRLICLHHRPAEVARGQKSDKGKTRIIGRNEQRAELTVTGKSNDILSHMLVMLCVLFTRIVSSQRL